MTARTPHHGASWRFKGLRVAVLESGTPIGALIQHMGYNWGIFGTAVYGSLSEGFVRLQTSPPDILFVNGIGSRHFATAVTRAVRDPERFRHPFMPIVAVLSEPTRARVTEIRDAGADEFLSYPFSSKSLYERIYSIVHQRRGFVDVEGYFGPDRRRGAMARYLGVNRRATPSILIDPRTGETYLDAG